MIESIRRRLTLGYVGILALILILFGVIVVTIFSAQLTREQDQRLLTSAQGAVRFVINPDSGEPERNGPPASVRQELESSGDSPSAGQNIVADIGVYVVPPKTSSGATDSDSDIYGRVPGPGGYSSSDLGLPFRDAAHEAERAGEPGFQTVEAAEGKVEVASLPVRDESGEVVAVVQAAQMRWAVTGTVNRLILVLVPVGVGSLLLAGIGGLFISRRAMQPVQESFQRQRTFVADASHELKTPLALVKIGSEVIKRNPTDPENEEIVDDQLSEIERMQDLLSGLLVLARLDAGKLDVEDNPFDLSIIAVETAERFVKRAAYEGVHLAMVVPEQLPTHGDPDRTAQILTALLDNAIRYTPKGGTITVSGQRLGDGVEARVEDTGPGISAGHLPHIFDRFYRAEEARTRAGGGSGLGLSIARDLAVAQNGDLSARNVADGAAKAESGAIFCLKLPAK
ncbi:MAG: HAMP domain-containing sensor histidine kinase [Rubrobacteraceae bacterium]